MLGAMSAAIHLASGLDPVADDLAAAMGARGGHRLDRAFEAVEGHRTTGASDLEGLVVIVAHTSHVSSKRPCPAKERARSEAQGLVGAKDAKDGCHCEPTGRRRAPAENKLPEAISMARG